MGRFLVVVEPSRPGALPQSTTVHAATAEEAREIVAHRGVQPGRAYALGWIGEGQAYRHATASELLLELGSGLRRLGDASGALRSLAARFPRDAAVLQLAAERAAANQTVSAALGPGAEWFGDVVLEVVRAGETHGRLADACLEAADSLEQHRPLAARGFLLTSNLWASVLLYLPALLVLAVLAALPVFARFASTAIATGDMSVAWARARSRLPLIGSVIGAVELGRFAQVFATLTRVGAPLTRAVELAVQSTGNADTAAQVLPRLRRVRDGERLSVVLTECSALPRAVAEFVATGEDSGRLDAAGAWLAERAQEEAERAVDRLSATLYWLAPATLGAVAIASLWVAYGQQATESGLSLPSPGEMWHNLIHGPRSGSAAP